MCVQSVCPWIRPHLYDMHSPLSSSIDVSSLTAAVYSTELCKRLRGFACCMASVWPPVTCIELLIEMLSSKVVFNRGVSAQCMAVWRREICTIITYWFGYRILNSTYLIFARQTRCHGLAQGSKTR